MKIYILAFTLLVLALLAPLAIGSSSPVLVFDRAEQEELIAKKYRAHNGMSVSASGQFSETELAKLFAAIPADKQDIWIIDLRQESHGFVNGLPISWYKNKNQANMHKTRAQIEHDEQELLESLRQQNQITVYTVKKLGEGEIAADKPVQITPHLIETEQELVSRSGAQYKRLYILDHHKPDNIEVDAYVDFIKNEIAPNAWLHFHCRGGKGRSSTFIAMYDMMQHAKTTGFADIMQRQQEMGNVRLDMISDKPEKKWKSQAAQQRYEFLQRFYAYSADPQGFPVQSWSEWLHNNPF